MNGAFERELARVGLSQGPGPMSRVEEEELTRLPPTVQRYLRFMGVVGQPRDWSFRLAWSGHFRLRPDGGWLPAKAWQYNTRLDVARVFRMRLRMGGVLPVVGHDTYVDGHGRLLVRLLDLITVEDAQGHELDVGELVTYLNDAVLLAPSLLLGANVEWSSAAEDHFEVRFTDREHTVSARVTVDERGAPTDFLTADRYFTDALSPEHARVRLPWSTPVRDFVQVGHRRIPSRGSAIWHRDDGPFHYARLELRPEDIVYNVSPYAL